MKSNLFDPHKSFLSLAVVKGTAITLFFMSLIAASIIATNSALFFDLTYEGFNLFFSVFRFPLALAALIIPIIALLAANHRSEQTKEQIRVTNEQNVFSNYYKHIEEFNKYLTGRVKQTIDLRFAHHQIYPNASRGDYAINPKLFDLLSELDCLIEDISKNYPSDISIRLGPDINQKYFSIMHNIYGFIYRDNNEFATFEERQPHPRQPSSYTFDSISLIKFAHTAIKDIELLTKFSIDYMSPISALKATHFNFKEFYVYQKSDPTQTLEFAHKKVEEQTLDEANTKFVDTITAILA